VNKVGRRNFKHRKGLSTIVGAVFMIIVMVAALNLTLWTIQQQDKVTETVIEKTNQNLNKLNEDIEISDVRIDGNKLNMTVTNAGATAATVKSIYVINETSKERYTFDVDFSVDGRESEKNVGQGLSLYIKDDATYSIRMITESGSIATRTITPLSSVALPMSLFIIPPTVTPTGSNVTILFAVMNNLTDSALGVDVVPTLDYTTSCVAGPSCELVEKQAPTSAHLREGNTILFKWVYEVTMPDLSTINFNASLVGAKDGNFVTETALVKKIDESNVSESTTLVVHSDLLQKPEIFIVAPGPFGDDNERGLWGIVISNPTAVDMSVSRIVISVYSTLGAQGSLDSDIVPSSGTCDSPIYPSSTSEWTCPHVNMIQWKDTSSPETVSPYSSKSFLSKILPGTVEEEPAFMISVAVFTNMGQFTKTGLSSGIDDNANAMANIFLSNTPNPSNAYQDANILTHINGIASGSIMTYNVTVVDFDTANSQYIKSGTKLIVNVPNGFTEVTVTSSTGFSSPSTTTYSDGSTQIVADLSANVGDISGTEAIVLSFTAKAPIVASEKIYLMYTLLDGETNPGDFSAGAFAQIPLQIVP
jgi:hypothetical protein